MKIRASAPTRAANAPYCAGRLSIRVATLLASHDTSMNPPRISSQLVPATNRVNDSARPDENSHHSSTTNAATAATRWT